METEEKKTPNQKLDVTINTSFKFTNDGIVVESFKNEPGEVSAGNALGIDSELIIKAIKNAQQTNRPLLNI